jgi:hypothetical protein
VDAISRLQQQELVILALDKLKKPLVANMKLRPRIASLRIGRPGATAQPLVAVVSSIGTGI